MRASTSPNPKRTQRMFAAGKLDPRGSRPCSLGWHAGPLLNHERYDLFPGGMWKGCGECAACMSTIHVSQLRRPA